MGKTSKQTKTLQKANKNVNKSKQNTTQTKHSQMLQPIAWYFFFLGTVSYTIDQVVLGNEYFGVQSNGDFYVKNGLTAFSSGTTLTVTATVADTGGLQGRSKKNLFHFF